METRVYNSDGLLMRDPFPGELYITKCGENHQYENKWLVSIAGDGTMGNDTSTLGIFWKKELAVAFYWYLKHEVDNGVIELKPGDIEMDHTWAGALNNFEEVE